jgi:hypothetical protein
MPCGQCCRPPSPHHSAVLCCALLCCAVLCSAHPPAEKLFRQRYKKAPSFLSIHMGIKADVLPPGSGQQSCPAGLLLAAHPAVWWLGGPPACWPAGRQFGGLEQAAVCWGALTASQLAVRCRHAFTCPCPALPCSALPCPALPCLPCRVPPDHCGGLGQDGGEFCFQLQLSALLGPPSPVPLWCCQQCHSAPSTTVCAPSA